MKNLIRTILLETESEESKWKSINWIEKIFGKDSLLNDNIYEKLHELGFKEYEVSDFRELIYKRNFDKMINEYGSLSNLIKTIINEGYNKNYKLINIKNQIFSKIKEFNFNKFELIKGTNLNIDEFIDKTISNIENSVYDDDTKIEEYVNKYSNNPTLAKEKFLKDVISTIDSKTIRTNLYKKFLGKLSSRTGEDYSTRSSRPEHSGLLLKLAKFIDEPGDELKSRPNFFKHLGGFPRAHYATTFIRLMRNGLIKKVKKNGKIVYELGPNFQKFVNGDPVFTGNFEELFEDYLSDNGPDLYKFWNDFRPLFYYDSDFRNFLKSYKRFLLIKGYE